MKPEYSLSSSKERRAVTTHSQPNQVHTPTIVPLPHSHSFNVFGVKTNNK